MSNIKLLEKPIVYTLADFTVCVMLEVGTSVRVVIIADFPKVACHTLFVRNGLFVAIKPITESNALCAVPAEFFADVSKILGNGLAIRNKSRICVVGVNFVHCSTPFGLCI
jgi:hypothetical protein